MAKNNFLKNLIVGTIALVLILLLRWLHSSVPGNELWRALGDTAFILLAVALTIGPLGKLWKPANKLIPLRRQFGIWFFIVATIHYVLILSQWFKLDFLTLLGYEQGTLTLPGFGLANIIGLVALLIAVALVATSFDRAVKYLGAKQWQNLHKLSHVIFYLISFHLIYFFYFYYAGQPELVSPFRIPGTLIIIFIITLQIVNYVKAVIDARKARSNS